MENNELFKENKRHFFLFSGFVLLIIIGIILLILRVIYGNNSICHNCIITGLTVCLLLILVFAILIYNRRLKQFLEYRNSQLENEKRRNIEMEQAKLNQDYRIETLKWDKIYQIAKLALEKEKPKDTIKNDDKDIINLPIAKSLIEAIKEIKNEIDKIEPTKTT